MRFSQEVAERFYNRLVATECGRCLLWVSRVRLIRRRRSRHVRFAPKADIRSRVNAYAP